MLKKEHDNFVFSLVKAVTQAYCHVRKRGTTWRNTIRITGKFIRKTVTKLKLFNYQSHSVLHAGIALALRKRLCFLSSLGCVIFRFSHTAICSMLQRTILGYSSTFFSITSTGRLKGDG